MTKFALSAEEIKSLFKDERKDHSSHIRFIVLINDESKDYISFICPVIRGRMSIVGSGTIEKDEDPSECLKRELFEEVGVTEYKCVKVDDNCFIVEPESEKLNFNISNITDSEGFMRITLFSSTDIDKITWSLSFVSLQHRDIDRSLTMLNIYLRLNNLQIKQLANIIKIEVLKSESDYHIFSILKGLRFLWEYHFSKSRRQYTDEYNNIERFIKEREASHRLKKLLRDE